MQFKQFMTYRATFAPRDTATFPLRDHLRPLVGKHVLVQANQPIDSDRARYEGEMEFLLANREPGDQWPSWFAEGDLSDIVEVSE